MIGPRIREARLARHLSLSAVAGKAEVSVATLSRIERDQQRIDVDLLITLMRILKIHAADVLGEEKNGEGTDPLVEQIATLPSAERAQLWRDLAAARKNRSGNATRAVAQQVEEFMAQLDFLRDEIESVRKKLR